ncbi:MAG: aspartate/glutamate racemase family protein [Sphingopyxis sp.]
MRKLGLIGGMSWAATEQYYRFINEEVQRRAGPPCSAPLVIDSLNFCDLARMTTAEQWAHATQTLVASAQRLEQAGATALLICANSMHKIYDAVQGAITIPIIHIVDPVGRAMKAANIGTAALLGTRNVMSESWYRQRLVGHGVSLVPAEAETVETVDRIIYDELMRGIVNRQSERELKTLLTKWDQLDVDGVALACTELSMIVDTEANVLPIFDSTRLHAMDGVAWILGDTP